MLKNGIYEQIINENINQELIDKNDEKHIEKEAVDYAESSKVFAKYVSEIVEKGLNIVKEEEEKATKGKKDEKEKNARLKQISLINKIVDLIKKETNDEDYEKMSVTDEGEQLLALYDKKNTVLSLDGNKKVTRPETSIAQSSLFTGAVHEPQMFTELKKEIASSDRIDMLVSFIRWSGLRLIIEDLKEFIARGGELRIITTSYMGATDIKAIEELRELNNTRIKISYDTKRTRLHAKTYVFYRNTGFTTAYVGSSNISNAALSSGLEWNVKVTQKDLPETIAKIEATFESYWNSNEFEYYKEDQKEKLARALKAEKYYESNNEEMYTMDIAPYSYQQEILDKLDAERKVRGHFKNLVVAATGTGKTVISALDYKRFRKENPDKSCRLLFVAHREEILKQSMYTFRAVLKDANFGDMFVGNYKPDSLDNLFISIQTLFISIQTFNSQKFIEKTDKDFYDYIIVDEFHHAAAPTYQSLLTHYEPNILLGLTATPERMDGKSILKYFDNRIAAEIRLPEAIDRKLLCPFQYFGVTYNVDLDDLKWSAGGYDKQELSNVYALDRKIAEKRAKLVVNSIFRYVADIDEVKGIGFCVSIEHAKFMSDFFNERGIPSIYLTGKSADEERKTAKDRLVKGEVRFIFVVDIYNEGVDIPEINTVLFLRPTESLTVFLQQLGRGLRLSEGKDCLTVLDFIGQANKRYNFEDKFAALLSNTNKSVESEIKRGFVGVPKGCYIQLEKKTKEHIMSNIKASYGNRAALVNKVATFEEDTGLELNLANFLEYYHLDPKIIYKYKDLSFSRLCVAAGVIDDFEDSIEKEMSAALYTFTSLDSRRWIEFLIVFLKNIENVEINHMSELEKRMLQMFYVTVWGEVAEDWNDEKVLENINKLVKSDYMRKELIELLEYNYSKIDFIDEEVDLGFDCPIDLHCTYTQRQLLMGFDYLSFSSVRQGVLWIESKKTDIFFITLNKSDKDYSPTTMYEDYSINDELFHWQSQSTTGEDSKTGKRYRNHVKEGSRVVLFVREFKNDKYGKTMPYTYLGTAEYVSHTGSKPMNIIWKLDKRIPAKYLKKTNKLVG